MTVMQPAPGDETVVSLIIESSRRSNPRHGITGLRVFGSGVFFQWLEGPRDAVTQLLAHLRTDSRHDSLVVISDSEEVRERVFPDWSMEPVTTAEIRAVLLDALGDTEDESNAQSLSLLLGQIQSSDADHRQN